MSYKDVMKKQRKTRKRREQERQRVRPRRIVLAPQPCDGCTACCTCVAVEELRKAGLERTLYALPHDAKEEFLPS